MCVKIICHDIVSPRWGRPNAHRPAHVIIMVADVLAPYKHQVVYKHNVDLTVSVMIHVLYYESYILYESCQANDV